MTALQEILDQAGMKRRELARRVGVDKTSIDRVCTGKGRGFSMPVLGAVARELSKATGRTTGEVLVSVVMPVALPPTNT